MRARASSPQRLSAIPSCAGLMTRLACRFARSAGIHLAPLLRRVGLTLRDVEDESVILSVATQIKCVNLIAETIPDRLLGLHVARKMDLRSTGLLYYVGASAETLGEALLKIARYSAIVNEGIELKAETGKTLSIGIGYPGVSRQSDRHQIEAWITALIRFCREMTGRDIAPIHVKIIHQRIAESAEFDSFCGRTAEFGADADKFVLPGEVAKLPIVSADPYLNRLLSAYCERALSNRQVPSGTLRANVENVITAELPHGRARLDVVAQKLGMTPRTLRRKLAVEDVSFARILEELRIALAKRYLAEHDLPISRVAWLLGYNEISSFSHAFRRWTGRPPRAVRSGRSRRRPAAHRQALASAAGR